MTQAQGLKNRTFARLVEEGTGFKAELTVGLLRAEGIPAYASTEGPLDEFTSAQRMVGRGVEVLVPEDRLEDAQRVLRGEAPLGEPEPDLLTREAMIEAAIDMQADDDPPSLLTPILIVAIVAGAAWGISLLL